MTKSARLSVLCKTEFSDLRSGLYLMGERAKTLVLLRDPARSIKFGALVALEETPDKDETVKAISHTHSTEAYLA